MHNDNEHIYSHKAAEKNKTAFEGKLTIDISLLEKCIWPLHDLKLWPQTLKTYSAMPTHMVSVC